MSEYMYPGYIKTGDIVRYCEEKSREYELTNPSYSDACGDIANKCLDLSNRDITNIKHGEWVKTYEYENDSPVQCSACLMEFDYIDGIGYLTDKELPNFCPNCGADMRGETDE